MKHVKATLVILLALFCVFVLVTQPENAANFVNAIFNGIATVINAIVKFFTSLAS